MAVTVDYNVTVTSGVAQGIFGIYNPFVAHMSIPSATKYKVAFRVRVTAQNDTSKTYIQDFDAVEDPSSGNYYASANVVEYMREMFFKSEYNGLIESTSTTSFSVVKIEIGEVSATSADLAPTFGGYDSEVDFYFYNGYEVPQAANQLIGFNYNEPTWSTVDATPILPKVKKTLYLLEDDKEVLSIPSRLPIYPNNVGVDTNLVNLITEIWDDDGIVSTTTLNLEDRAPALEGIGYWNISVGVNPTLADGQYAKVYAQWIIFSEEPELIDSEIITVYRDYCRPKDDNYRLRWINRYGGEEFENFQLKTDKSITIERGKRVASTGIDYAATSFANIGNINNPNLRETNNSYYTRYTLRTDFINQERLNALQEAYRNNNVVMFDPEILSGGEPQLVPVIVEDRTYKILDTKQGLKKVEMRVRLANTEPNQI